VKGRTENQELTTAYDAETRGGFREADLRTRLLHCIEAVDSSNSYSNWVYLAASEGKRRFRAGMVYFAWYTLHLRFSRLLSSTHMNNTLKRWSALRRR